MQSYQLTILINNNVEEKARTSLLDSLNKDLGSNIKQEAWGVRGLAYEIGHQEKAFYAHFNFEAEPSTIPAIDRKLKLNEDIIRYLLIKSDTKKVTTKSFGKKETPKVEVAKTVEAAEVAKSEEKAEVAASVEAEAVEEVSSAKTEVKEKKTPKAKSTKK